MSFLDVFKFEQEKRKVYGVIQSDGHKILILTYLINRVNNREILHKLYSLYDLNNKGEKEYTYVGVQ